MNKLEFLKNIKLPAFRRPTTKEIIFWSVAVVFAGAAFQFARELTKCWQLTQLPGRMPDVVRIVRKPLTMGMWKL